MPNRRDFLTGLAAGLVASKIPLPAMRGWLPECEPHAPFADMPQLYGSGEGKTVLLWKLFNDYVPHRQLGNDCVGHATALGVDTLAAIQSYYGLADWRGKHSTETIYAGSRIDIGVEKHGKRVSRFFVPGRTIVYYGGSSVGWAVEWLKDYGALLRGKYGEYDLSEYNYAVTKAWANTGVPTEIDEHCKRHPLLAAVRVNGGWKQACDLVANGYPIVIGSTQGFDNKYDSDGFLKPSKVWFHAMLLWGVDAQSSRPGGNLANSAGDNWVSGPKHKLGTPPGSIWADAAVIDKMLEQGGSYALSSFSGYPRTKRDYKLY